MPNEVEKFESKEEFLSAFKDLQFEEFLPATYTAKQKEAIAEATKPSRTKTSMFASIPMVCKAEKCSFADTCPLQKQKIAPLNSPCPIEMAMSVQFTGDYIEQLKIDEGNLIELSLVRNLVDYEVQYLRASKFLSKESFIQENVVGIDQNGEVILKKELHLAVELQEKLIKRQKELLKQLMATREAKAKIGLGALDTAQTIASLMGDFRQITAAAEKAQLEKLGMLDYDAFIEEAEIVRDKGDG
jgi:hypothetical protein